MSLVANHAKHQELIFVAYQSTFKDRKNHFPFACISRDW
jgi:hypothetical protein